MKKYYYKTHDYDYWREQWLAKDPMKAFEDEHPEIDWETYLLEHDTDALAQEWYAYNEAHLTEILEWQKHEPILDEELIPVDRVCVDLVTGCPTARKLLLHVETTKKFPLKAVMDVLKSQRARHKNRGPYFHSVDINIYPVDMTCWASNFKRKEVDLWQENLRVAADVAAALWAEAFTVVRIPRVYHY